MSNTSKVIWSEGMFLRPQHFQQQDRYVEQLVEGRCQALAAYGWGFRRLVIDQQLLAMGKVAITEAVGVLPDGTPFSTLDSDTHDLVLDVPPQTRNCRLYLAVPLRRAGAVEVASEQHAVARYVSQALQTADTVSDMGEISDIDVGTLRLRLLLETDDLSGYACLPIANIIERKDDKSLLLDDDFIPTCVDIAVSKRLSGFVQELGGLIHHRAEALSARLSDGANAAVGEIADYLMLQLLNRIEPLMIHLSTIQGLHPQRLYSELLQLSGELATFTSPVKRPNQFPHYLHDDLQETFAKVLQGLRHQLSTVIEQSATPLEWVTRKYGIRVCTLADKSLVGSAQFVLAVKADLPTDKIRGQFASHAKLGPVERIRELVNAQMPGIALHALPVAPRQIPYHTGYVYFELDPTSDFWRELRQSGGFALHVGAEYPGLELAFWAIRAN